MKHVVHSYRLGMHGRSLSLSRAGTPSTAFTATVECSQCGAGADVSLRQIMPPDQIDKKFIQRGWKLDPHICRNCQRRAQKEKKMTTPSASAMKAQATMFRLLSDHFDTDAGQFDVEWSDERIAKETGLAKAIVTEFRRAGFGEIKEPSEVASLRADINALEALAKENATGVSAEIAALRARLAKISAQFGA